MASKVRTVKAPSLKANIVDDVKEQVEIAVESRLERAWNANQEERMYLQRRIEKLEDKNFERDTTRLSLTDWCMIACYAAIFVGAIVVTIRALKNKQR